jgi:hypothetical protein
VALPNCHFVAGILAGGGLLRRGIADFSAAYTDKNEGVSLCWKRLSAPAGSQSSVACSVSAW